MVENQTETMPSLSSFMDGELDGDEAAMCLSRLYSDEALRSCWHRYHLIGDALRNNLPPSTRHDLANRVAQLIADEPPLLCPTPQSTASTKRSSNKSRIAYATAASVALLGVLTVGLLQSQLNNEQAPRLAVADPDSAAVVPPVANQPVPVVVVSQEESMVADGQVQPKLRSYMLKHEYSTSSTSRRGLPPSVRVVTFSNSTEQ